MRYNFTCWALLAVETIPRGKGRWFTRGLKFSEPSVGNDGLVSLTEIIDTNCLVGLYRFGTGVSDSCYIGEVPYSYPNCHARLDLKLDSPP